MKRARQVQSRLKKNAPVSANNKSKKKHKNSIIEVQRHEFGLITIYFLTSFGVLISWSSILAIGGLWQNNKVLVILTSLFIMILISTLLFLINKVYKGNYLIISETEIRQITKKALFSTKLSVLGLANIEDVTIIRRGVFAHIFDYGTLNIETAGEQENFKFIYCPKPKEFGRQLMSLREEYLKENNSDQVLR